MSAQTPARDWRADYIICEHIADGTAALAGMRHAGFRACCETCYEDVDDRGVPKILYGEVDTWDCAGLSVMRIAGDAIEEAT